MTKKHLKENNKKQKKKTRRNKTNTELNIKIPKYQITKQISDQKQMIYEYVQFNC